MDKKEKKKLSESDICDLFISPAIRDAGWDPLRQIRRHVLPAFSERILPVDTAVAQCCAKLHVPDPHSDRDALIVATALIHGLTVVSRNTHDFVATGVELLDPWEPHLT